MMWVRWIAVPLAGAALTWPFRHRPPVPPRSAPVPSVVEGAQLYHRACLSCHGPRGDGEGLVLLPNNEAAPPLNNLQGEAQSVDSLTRIIQHGSGLMPAWGAVMTPEQIKSVALYVASLNQASSS